MNVDRPEICDHPLIQADDLRHYISDRLRNADLDLYSAFMLSHESNRIGRLGYLQSAWGHQLSISGLLRIFMHGVTAIAFNVDGIASVAQEWYTQDHQLLAENRAHFLMGCSRTGDMFRNSDFLTTLSELREQYDSLSDDDGPYHVDVFPWHFAAPEREVLNPKSQNEFQVPDSLDSEVESLIADLNAGQWA